MSLNVPFTWADLEEGAGSAHRTGDLRLSNTIGILYYVVYWC